MIEKKLSVLDDSTHSRMLISTRIRGLVAGANEVQVQLLTLQEGVEMLCTMVFGIYIRYNSSFLYFVSIHHDTRQR
jgi:hypothetical protein